MQAVPVAPASTGAAATLSASLLITLAIVPLRFGAATANSIQSPPAARLPPVSANIAPTKLEMASVTRLATAMPASGMGVTVPSLWRTPGPTAPPHSPAGITSTTSVMSCATQPSASLTTLNARGTARHASMTSIVQTTSKITTVTRDATVRSVAGTGWTVLLTDLRTWQRARWSLWC